MASIIRNFLFFLIPFTVLLSACDNSPKKPALQPATGEERHEYKRFTGNIAGQKVVVNLYVTTSGWDVGYTGNYFYKGKSQVIDFTEAENETASGGEVYLNEYVETEDNGDESKPYPQWRVKIEKDRIKGRWLSADKKITQEIDLFEDYDEAYSFTYIHGSDSVTVNSKTSRYKLQADYKLMVPSDEVGMDDAKFIEQSLGRELGGDTMNAGSLYEYVQAKNKIDFKDYLGTMAGIMNDKEQEDRESNNWQTSVMNLCRYNDNELLVFDVNEYSYMGGAHGSYYSKYVCLDLKERKVIHLEDVMTVDTARLMALLDTAAHELFGIAQGAALGERLLVDTVPITRNIAISDVNITFYYNIYEIASYADGQKCIFMPYAKIEDLLLPAFKERMGL